ncbi:MAG: hypothetical protein JWP12_3808 [Bacteroidetes bacterium]|nr:hypothetical protein [Bacteroidota bacterium]
MKKSLQNKLKSYSALAGAVATAGVANAQIVYTDVNPDITVDSTSNSVDIDLDNGGIIDFTLGLQSGTVSYSSTIYNYNAVLTLPNPTTGVNAIAQDAAGVNSALNLNDPIDASLTWATDTVQLAAFVYPASTSFNVGNWIGVNDKYFGFRFDLAGTTHYGWARFDVAADGTTAVLKDYAYDATANTAIPAGAMPTTTSINELLAHNTQIYGFDNSINVKLFNTTIDGVVTVTDVLGQQVAKIIVTDATTTIEMSNAKAGVYFVNVTKANGSSYTKKLFMK